MKQEEVESANETFLVQMCQYNRQSTLIFHQNQLEIRGQDRYRCRIPNHDLIGFQSSIIKENKTLFQLNHYPKIKKFMRKQQRYVEKLEFTTCMSPFNIQRIKVLLLRRTTNREIDDSNQKLRMLAYFNPISGSNSRLHLQKAIKFIQLSNFSLDVIETTHKNHCRQHLATISPKDYSAVLIISGDGLMHEFVNSPLCGIVPVTQVPAGSGNAFARYQSAMAGEQCNDETSVFLAIKGKTVNLNITRIQLEEQEHPIYSFLSLQWAFFADIDMNSEFLRILGGLRFEVYSAYRVIALKRYFGKLTYSLSEEKLPPLNEPIENTSFHTVETNFLNAIFCTIPFITEKHEFAPLLLVEDKAIDMQFNTEQQGRMQFLKYLLSAESGSHFNREKQSIKEGLNFGHGKVKSYRLEPLGEEKGLFGIDGQHYKAQRVQVCMDEHKLLAFV